MDVDSLVAGLDSAFLILDVKWMIDGQLKTPEPEDIRIVLEEMLTIETPGIEHASIERGGILMKRSEGKTDIYLRIGEYESN